MAFDLDQIEQRLVQREQWLHQEGLEGDPGPQEAPPALSVEQILAENDDKKMHAYSNFSCAEFEMIWSKAEAHVMMACSGGNRSRLTPKTWFLITLYWCKHMDSWRTLAEALLFAE